MLFDGPASYFLMFRPAMLRYYASLGIIILLSIERFLVCIYITAFSKAKNETHTCTTLRYSSPYTILCVMWPDEENYETMPETINICMDLIRGPTFTFRTAASVFIAAFFVPMIVIGIMNIKIVATLKRKNHPSSVSIKFANIRKSRVRCLF